MSLFLTIENDSVVLMDDRDVSYRVDSVEGYRLLLESEASRLGVTVEDLTVMASSSMDFPEDFTTNPQTVQLARELR